MSVFETPSVQLTPEPFLGCLIELVRREKADILVPACYQWSDVERLLALLPSPVARRQIYIDHVLHYLCQACIDSPRLDVLGALARAVFLYGFATGDHWDAANQPRAPVLMGEALAVALRYDDGLVSAYYHFMAWAARQFGQDHKPFVAATQVVIHAYALSKALGVLEEEIQDYLNIFRRPVHPGLWLFESAFDTPRDCIEEAWRPLLAEYFGSAATLVRQVKYVGKRVS